jgi:hypothetical protein
MVASWDLSYDAKDRHAQLSVWQTTPYTKQGPCHTHDRSRHHFTRILQTKAEPGPSHFGFSRHNCPVGLARIYLTRRSARPSRLSDSGCRRRRNPLCCDLGGPPLLVPTEAREATDADPVGTGPLSRERGSAHDKIRE